MCNAVEGRTGTFILFHKEKFHTGLVLMLEYGFEIYYTAADFGKTLISFLTHILNMPERKPAWMFLE